jgi:hypothetical protein
MSGFHLVDGFHDSVGTTAKFLSLAGGQIASDNVYDGCRSSICDVAGFWQSDIAVADPGSAALLLSGLAGTAYLGRRRAKVAGNTELISGASGGTPRNQF